MIANLAFPLVAGAASALMVASIASGQIVAAFLYYLAPLPLIAAGLGWGPLAALIAGAFAAAALGLVISPIIALIFVLSVALPAWWLSYLALLAQPLVTTESANSPPALQWYPTGRLLLWIVVCACVLTTAAMLMMGGDAETIHTALRDNFNRMLASMVSAADREKFDRSVDILVYAVPSVSAVGTAISLTVCLWLAGRLTAASGRLNRPWPDLRYTEMPQPALLALALSLALSFMGGTVAMFAQFVSASLLVAYTMIGFAVLHVLLRNSANRYVWLATAYVATLLLFAPLLFLVTGLGIIDAASGLRTRLVSGGPPPTPSSNHS